MTADSSGARRTRGSGRRQGRNAIVAAAQAIARIPSGRIDPETTANAGVIRGHGGERGRRALPGRVEVRSLDDARRAAGEKVVTPAPGPPAPPRPTSTRTWRSTSAPTGSPRPIRASRWPPRALRDCGSSRCRTPTGGGSDASVFEDRGLRCLNVANGTEANHTSDERVTSHALEMMLDFTYFLAARAAAAQPVRD